jgi:Skp family chaperone for outer membrane proteins
MGLPLGLLLKIAADPSQAEAVLKGFSTKVASSGGAMALSPIDVGTAGESGVGPGAGGTMEAAGGVVAYNAEVQAVQKLLPLYTQLTAAQQAAQQVGEASAQQLAERSQWGRQLVAEMLSGEVPAQQRLQTEFQRNLDALDREIAKDRERATRKATTTSQLQAHEGAYTEAFRAYEQVREGALEREKQAQESMLVHQGAFLLQQLGFRRAAAAVEAVWETARGFASLAEYDFWAAAQHFLSAAEYGIVAGTGGGQGSAAGGATRGRSSESERAAEVSPASLTPAQQAALLAPGAAGALAGPTGNVTVMVMGEPNAAAYIANILNQHVTNRDGRLVASHSVNPVSAAH